MDMDHASSLQPLGASGDDVRIAEAVPVQVTPGASTAEDDDGAARARRRRLRWQVSFALALALAIASCVVVATSAVYEARSTVLIRPPEAKGGVPLAVGGALQSEVEILRSFDVLRQALESIGVDVLYPGLGGETPGALRAAAVARMRDALAVRTRPDSDVIEVTFRHPDAQLAADVVSRLVERFQRSRPAMLSAAASRDFLHERIEGQRETLAAAENALAAFHAEHPGLAAGEPQRALAERRLALEDELRALRDAADEARGSRAARDPSVERARARLDELELELQGTLESHVEGSRAVTKLQSEIGRVRAFLAGRERAAARERERRIERLDSRRRELETRLTALAEAERALPELELRAREFARARDVAARRLDAYQRELETATLAADTSRHAVEVSARVLEAAQPPTSRTIPGERARAAWALLGGALLVLLGSLALDVFAPSAPRPPPALWAAHVGAGAADGSLALVLPGGERGASGGPALLLRRASGDAPGCGASGSEPLA
jgi:uncharacterized protein involved in exopolysaccharide biosynthesis